MLPSQVTVRDCFQILRATFKEFSKDKALRLAAALAYYAAFSLAPLIIIAVALAAMFFGEDAVRGRLDEELSYNLGSSGAAAIQDMVAHARRSDGGWLGSIVGVAILIFGAGGVFGQLQDALNALWGVEPKPGRSFARALRERFMSFGMVLGTGFLLLVSMVVSTVLASVSRYTGELVHLPTGIWEAVSGVASFAVVTLLFAAIFKVLPDAKVQWRHVWAGAIFTATLFVIGKSILAWYLGRQATESSYGAAGALALVLLWVYYSSLILLFGAEFTQVWANWRGHPIEPAADAQRAANYK